MSHAQTPPELPEITDEAGDTPRWVPLLGLALFALTAIYIGWAHRQHEAGADTSSAQQAE